MAREISALKFILLFRVTYVLLMAGFHIFIGKGFFEKYFTLFLCLIVLCFTIMGFFLLARKKFLRTIGIIGVGLDLSMVAFLPFLWYDAAGGWDSVPAIFIAKAPTSMVLAMIITLSNGFVTKALYPLLCSIGIVLINFLHLIFALQDPRTIIEADVVGHILGPKFNPQLYIAANFIFFVSGISFSFFLARNRKTIEEAVRLECSNGQIRKYFSPKVFDHITTEEISEHLQVGRTQKVAVLFSDLKGFTTLSEKLAAEEVVKLLSEYHAKMVSVIFQNGGTLDKFMGDGIMATFGTPHPGADDAGRALQCAKDMRHALAELNEVRSENGQPLLSQGIGLHYGEVIAGNIGTQGKLEYTVIGDTVNVASRLEKVCKKFSTDIIFSESLLTRANLAQPYKSLGLLKLHGKETQIQVYTIA